jgi:hypothetical protein
MIPIDFALRPNKPDVDQVLLWVNGVPEEYNANLVQIAREARNPR